MYTNREELTEFYRLFSRRNSKNILDYMQQIGVPMV